MHPTTQQRPLRRPAGRAVLAAATFALVLGFLGPGAGPASATHTAWASASSATIHPGAQTITHHPGVLTITEGSQCTANFVFVDSTDVYLGQAAHCAGTGGATATNGCDTGSLRIGTEITVSGAEYPAKLAYSSWLTMQQRKEKNTNACQYNDFALVRLDRRDHARVNPSVPFWGGPERLGFNAASGETVYSYGNSSLRLGLQALSPKTGLNLWNSGDDWTSDVYMVTPVIPGDSGGGFMDEDGEAIGVGVTVQIAPYAGSNGVTNLKKALAYANTHTSLSVQLAKGTEAFQPIL